MNIKKKIRPLIKFVVIISTILLVSAACNSKKPTANYRAPLTVGSKQIFVEIMDTPQKQAQGLSGREKLESDQGMLFDFSKNNPEGVIPNFWMKEMKFNLDIIWIWDKKIIGITTDVPAPLTPQSELPFYSPPTPVDMVLEVNANWSEKNDVKVGNEVGF